MTPVDTSENSSFSFLVPGLQLAVDSTSLGAFKECPRKYYYSIVLGWQPSVTSVHLTWGLLLHRGRELYDHRRTAGMQHEDALEAVVLDALRATWEPAVSRGWISDLPAKSRLTLLRALVWYLDEFGANDPFETVVLANGKPAVELSFRFDSGYSTRQGEQWLLCGHLDRIATLNGVEYIIDLKSTLHALDAGFFGKFSPDNQFSLYTLAGHVAFGRKVEALIVDGVQTGVGFTRFERGIVQRPLAAVEEWLIGTGHWLRSMEDCAESGEWPMNDKSCGNYGGCLFRSVCSRSPVARETWLKANFTRRIWDPLRVRGDV